MNMIHFVLVTVAALGKARATALAALDTVRFRVHVADRRIPAGHKSAYAHGSQGFSSCIHTANLMQASSLLSVNTMLSSIFGEMPAKEFETLYLHNPDEYKRVLANAFRFMGECAADSLLDRRTPRAEPGLDWHRGDFNPQGFLDGLDEMCRLKKLLAGNYCKDSYFLNTLDMSAHIPSETTLQTLRQEAAARGEVLAIVPVTVCE